MTNIPTALAINPVSGMFTQEYAEPWRFRILIKDKYNQDTLYTIDQFSQNNPFAVTDLNYNTGVQNTGDFAISINDTKDRAFDRNIVDCGNFLVIQAGQSPSTFQNMLYGRLDAIGTTRTRHEQGGVIGSGRIFDLGGHGTGSIFNQRFINVNIAVPKEAVNITKIIQNDPKYYISNIFSGIIEGTDVLPVSGLPTLKDNGNFSLDQIADNIKQVIPGASQTMVLAAQFLSFLADSAGAIWGVDENNSVYLKYPSGKGRHSGITIKSIDDPEDLAYCTSYAIADFGWIDSILPEDGFANALYGIASNIDSIASGTFEAESFSSLYKKDICQQIIPGAAKFRDLVLYLSKTGPGTAAPNPIADLLIGKIVKDDGADNPTGALLGNFYIPVKDIIESPQAMYISNLNLLSEDIDPTAKYWFCLQAIGGSEENTIRIWHNNNFTDEAQTLASGFRIIYEYPAREFPFGSNKGWIKSFHGPNYTYAISTKLKKITYVSDPLSILRWTPTGAVEAMVNLNWINDAQTMQIYLNELLYLSSKLQRQYTYNVCTIPTTMFRNGTFVTIEDHLLPEFEEGRNVIAEVQEMGVSYSGSALTNQGISELVIRPKGFVSPDSYKLIDNDESLEVEFLE